jgi:hypothetical protein
MSRPRYGSRSVDKNAVDRREQLEQLFNVAAARSLAEFCAMDAEPEMAQLVGFVRHNPDLRQDVIHMFVETFTEGYPMQWPPTELWRYFAHALRWPELREFISAKRDEEVSRRGARCSGIWNDILEAFADDWEGAKYFEAFK